MTIKIKGKEYDVIKFSELFHFTPKQQEATQAADTHKFTLMGGAGGGGKSHWLRWYAIRKLLKWYKATGQKGIRAALFCEDYPTLVDRHLSKIKYEFPEWLGKLSSSQSEGLSFIINPQYGAGVLCLRNLDDASKYKSSEFALVAIDELTRNPQEVFDFLRFRMRWPGISDVKFIAGTNPGEIGHLWVKNKFIDKIHDKNEMEAGQFCFVKSLVYDNPYIDKQYIVTLDSLPDKLRAALRDGNWDVFEGQYFEQWKATNEKGEGYHVIEPFPIPSHWKRFVAIDWGYDPHYFVALWFAVTAENEMPPFRPRRMYVYRELNCQRKTPEMIWPLMQEVNGDDELAYIVFDPSCYNKRRGMILNEDAPSIVDQFVLAGMPKKLTRRGNNDRINGWMECRKYLGESPDGLPWLQFFSSCSMAVKTIPAQVHDETVQEDLDSDNEYDDWADAWRYGVMTRPFKKGGGTVRQKQLLSTRELMKKTYEVNDNQMPNVYKELIERQLKKHLV